MLVPQVVQVCTESCGMKSCKRKNVSVPARGAGVHGQRVCACCGTVQDCMLREFVPAVGQECMLRELCLQWGRVTQCVCSQVVQMCRCGFFASEFCVCRGVGVYSELVPAVWYRDIQ
jgi:hypothetical protein